MTFVLTFVSIKYLCCHNMYHFAGESMAHEHLKTSRHMIAMPHNFKGQHDTIGNLVNVDIRKMENFENTFCKDPLMAFQMLEKRYKQHQITNAEGSCSR